MGIFDGDTESYAFIGSSAIIEPPDYIDSVKTAVLSAIRNDGESIPNNVVLGSKMGFTSAIEKFQEYAEHEYYFSPPLVYEYTEHDYSAQIKAAITQEVGEPISIDEIYWGGRSPGFLNFNNDPAFALNYPDSIVVKLSTAGEYYKGLQLRFAEILQKDATWIRPADWDAYRFPKGTTGIQGPPEITFDYQAVLNPNNVYKNEMYAIQSQTTSGDTVVQVGFPWVNPSDPDIPISNLWSYRPTSSSFSPSSDSIWAVEYHLKSNPDQPYYWTYAPSSNTYPSIGVKFTRKPNSDSKFLGVCFWAIDQVDWTGNQQWKDSNIALMDELGMDAEKIWDQMQSNGVAGGDTWDLFTHFGCPINNSSHPKDSRVVQEYLYLFFEEISKVQKSRFFEVQIGGPSGYANGYFWEGVTFSTHYTKPREYRYWKASKFSSGKNPTRTYFTFTVWYDHPDGTYRELQIANLQQLFLTNTKDGFRLAYVDNWETLYMEVKRDLIKKLKLLHKERFLQACFRGTAIVVKQEKIPFYASSAWKFIFVIVTVILIAISLQVQLAGVTATLGLAQGTVATTLITTVLKLTTSFLISFTGNLISDGNFIVTVLTTILTFVLFGFDWKDLGTFDKILKVTSSVQKIQSAYEQMNVEEDYMDGYKDYLETPKERQERLEDEYLGMDRNSGIDAHVAILRSSASYMFAETPDQFFNRTKETNPGMRMVESVGSFVDIMLQLPKDRLPPQPQPKEAL